MTISLCVLVFTCAYGIYTHFKTSQNVCLRLCGHPDEASGAEC